MRVVSLLIVNLLLAPLAHGATPVNTSGWTVPRTEYGHPDLQGIWSNRTQTPIARPVELGERRAYTAEEALALEAAAYEQNTARSIALDPERGAPEVGTNVGQEADQDFSDNRTDVLMVDGEYRTSMIVDPPDGQYPFLEGGRQKDIFGRWRAQGFGPTDGPEIRPAGERCLSRGVPPMTVPPYNSNYQIVQTQDYVMLLGEMVHDARIVRLDSNHLTGGMKSWLGDSIGHWEADTLVINTKNFRPEISHFRVVSSEQMELIERFRMVNDNEIFYSFTVTDAEIYSQPFTEELTLRRHQAGAFLYEYACHEGNYSFAGILAGARRQEADARAQINSKQD